MIKKSIAYRVLHFPLTKIVAGFAVLIAAVWLGQKFGEFAADKMMGPGLRNFLKGSVTALLSILFYIVLYRFYEKRKITELSGHLLGRNLVLGVSLGAVLQSLTIFIIWLNGGFSVIAANPISFLAGPLTMAFTSAIFEEILVRGIIFRILEEKLGSYIALGTSALIFGALHLGNANSSLITALGLAIQAGLLLGAAFVYAKNLWLPIAIHFAWNFTQSGIYGASVSGNASSKTLFTTRIEGPEWLTGGAFGPEGSIQATLFCLVATFVLLILCRRQNKIVLPAWKRSAGENVAGPFI